MATTPQFGAVGLIGFGQATVANTNRDGTGTLTLLCVGRAPGTRVDLVQFKAVGATTAGLIRLYKRDNGLTLNADGTVASFALATARLIKELIVTVATPSGTVPTFEGSLVLTTGDNVLREFESLLFSMQNAETMNGFAIGSHL